MGFAVTKNLSSLHGSTSDTPAGLTRNHKSVVGLAALTSTCAVLAFAWSVTPQITQPTVRPSYAHRLLFEDKKLLQQPIREYIQEADGWDGYHGKHPSPQAEQDVKTFIKMLPSNFKSPRKGVSGDGEIGLFWEKDQIYIDIGFVGNHLYSFYARDSDGIEYFGDDISVSSEIDVDLIRLMGQVSN